MSKQDRSKQTYTNKPIPHKLDSEMADILLLNDEERCFVTHFLSGKTEQAACEWVAKDLNIPVNTGYNRRIKVKQYIALAIKQANQVLKKQDSDSVITVTEVVDHLATMLRNEDGSEEGRVRVKSAEILLKHMDGFKRHNESKAPKTAILINNLSDEELQERIVNLQNSIVETINIDRNTLPQLNDLGDLSEDEIYSSFEEVRQDD